MPLSFTIFSPGTNRNGDLIANTIQYTQQPENDHEIGDRGASRAPSVFRTDWTQLYFWSMAVACWRKESRVATCRCI